MTEAAVKGGSIRELGGPTSFLITSPTVSLVSPVTNHSPAVWPVGDEIGLTERLNKMEHTKKVRGADLKIT